MPRASLPTRIRPEYTERARVGDRALEQQVAGGLRGDVVLDGAEVVHPVAVGEVDGGQVAGAALAVDAGVGADAGVVAAEGDHGGLQGGVAADPAGLVADLEDPGPEVLHVEVAQAGGVAHVELDDGVGERGDVRRRLVLDDRGVAVLAGQDDGAGEGGDPVAVEVVDDHDRPVDDHAAGDAHDGGAGQEGGVQLGEGVGDGGCGSSRSSPSGRSATSATTRPLAASAGSTSMRVGRPLWTTTRAARSPVPSRQRRRRRAAGARPGRAGRRRGRARRCGCSARSPRTGRAAIRPRTARPRPAAWLGASPARPAWRRHQG